MKNEGCRGMIRSRMGNNVNVCIGWRGCRSQRRLLNRETESTRSSWLGQMRPPCSLRLSSSSLLPFSFGCDRAIPPCACLWLTLLVARLLLVTAAVKQTKTALQLSLLPEHQQYHENSRAPAVLPEHLSWRSRTTQRSMASRFVLLSHVCIHNCEG